MKVLKFKFLAVALTLISAIQISFVSCSDDPGVDSYYTSTSEYASDYLAARPQFSSFCKILERAKGSNGKLRLMDLLGTYGSYTVFAPTNEAIDEYLKSMHKSSIDELTDADCDTLALNAIIEQEYFTSDKSDDTYPQPNMLDRYLTISSTTEWSSEKNDSVAAFYIGKKFKIEHADDSVSNGVVHTMSSVVGASNDMLPQLIRDNKECQIFWRALEATNMKDSLMAHMDQNYENEKSDKFETDSASWTNDALCIHTAVEYDNVAYPLHRYFKFTVFVCPDSILKEKYGITDLEGLRTKAKELYEPMYPEDAGIEDETDRRNYLNRFISYHILDRQGTYYTLTANDGGNLAINFNRRKWDIADWYETMMPYSIMKCSFPNGSQQGLYLNRRGVQSRADERGVFVRGAKVSSPSEVNFDGTAINGVYHYIDDIIAYDKNTQEVVLNERYRMDCSTLSPDFMTSGARGHYTKSSIDGGRYGNGGQGAVAAKNVNTCYGFKPGFAKNIEYDKNTHLHVRMRVLTFWSYEGDEVTVKGRFNLKIKLPPVPAGTYEVRMFTCVDFTSRGIMQAYIDDIPQGIPFDMRWNGQTLFGWTSDSELGDDDAIAAFDKSIHNNGWMKGPKSYYSATNETGGTQGQCFRDAMNTIRKVLGTYTTTGKEDHYLRLQQKMESEDNEMNFDFIEIVPSTVYNNEYFAEDRW